MNIDDDITFAEAMRDVKPLKRPDRTPLRGKAPAPRAVHSRAARAAMLRESLTSENGESTELGEEVALRRHHVSERAFRELRRGRFAVEAEIDLHGMTSAQARDALKAFVAESVARGYGCVRVVHGKGRRSGVDGPVLKALVPSLLARWDDVLAFATARQRDGGSGALYVLLARR